MLCVCCWWKVDGSFVRLTVRCVFTVSTDEKQLHTKSEGSDVSPATDQLTEDKHGRRMRCFFRVL